MQIAHNFGAVPANLNVTKGFEFVQHSVDVFDLGASLPHGWVLDHDNLNSGTDVDAQVLRRQFLDRLLLGFLKKEEGNRNRAYSVQKRGHLCVLKYHDVWKSSVARLVQTQVGTDDRR